MSHIVDIATQVRDPLAVTAACRRLRLPEPVRGKTKLFSGEATGLSVRLPDWKYPIVCDTATGKVHYDNYDGVWGDAKELNRFLQMYAIEKARLEARKQGHTVTEQPLPNGSVRLTINIGNTA